MARKDKKRSRTAAKPGIERDPQGRVHLALHRDPASGREVVVLEEPLFQEAWQDELTAGAANTTHGVLQSAPTVARAIELGQSVMAATSAITERLLGQAPAGSVACKSGCDHCCYQAVGVTPPEALAIADHLKRTRRPDELAGLKAKLADRFEATRGLTPDERFSPEHPCPFLESARCTIYDVRPLSCRGMNSLDAGECERRLREPEARAAFLKDGTGSRSYMEPIRAFHAVSAGMQLALSELYALDTHALDLTAAVHLLLKSGDALPRDWIAGKPSFAPARATSQPGDRGLLTLSGLARPPER
jgi:Fe-S-cluster containining protein